ncbi:DUF3147 family protein [Bradyrhizobium sp. ARR65]|uniref:DUF3147 family protein n=1 Tax=Bradyrhizobium sp. ARR65 TaxID=1040989 RepID=UPI0004637467|nr:DUF3147 family protein [Bradyrhizobium sp. ARR65]
MPVHLKPQGLQESRWYEHVVRFGLGGLATVLAGIVAKIDGPATGGLFLAFPAIFCASATLIEKHERKRKEKKGLAGRRRGQEAAALDSAGAGWGSIALAVFGLVVWLLARQGAVLTLFVACVAWLVVAVSAWWLRRLLRHTRRNGAARQLGVASDRKLPDSKARG